MSDAPLFLSGLGAVRDRYDAVICDLWGVVHDGLKAYPAAVEALTRLRGAGGTVVLLSNAPRPYASIKSLLDRLGAPPESYDDIVSSGGLTQAAVRALPSGTGCLHVGPERDLPVFDGAGVRLVDVDEAEIVVCSGLYDDLTETPEDYVDLLAAARARGLPMLCANPDIQVMRGPEILWCAGALAAAYEKIGGTVTWYGKPHKPAFEAALGRIAHHRGAAVARDRVLVIGDGLGTDVKGATDNGLDCLLVTGGLHSPLFGPDPDAPKADRVAAEVASRGLCATWFAPQLVW